jgi:hypothetical protein
MPKLCGTLAVHFSSLFCGLMLLDDPCLSAEKITAFLTDGRQVTGLVDARTDSERLWVRREEINLEVASGFVWEVVADVRKDGQSLEPVEIQAMAMKDKPTTLRFQKRAESLSDHPSSVAVKMPRPKTTTEPVKSLVVRACLAQWDDDPQSDGIRVWVLPLDARGRLVPVDGQIDLSLVIQDRGPNRITGSSRYHGYGELDRISHMVRREHFKEGPAAYDLPFANRHPDVDINLATHALLNARLGVPGYGVFEASDAQLSIREFSYFRDELQLHFPQRHLPLEGQRHR